MNFTPLRDMSRDELKKELHEITMSGILLGAEEKERRDSLNAILGLYESELARRDTHRLTKLMVVAVVCNARYSSQRIFFWDWYCRIRLCEAKPNTVF